MHPVAKTANLLTIVIYTAAKKSKLVRKCASALITNSPIYSSLTLCRQGQELTFTVELHKGTSTQKCKLQKINIYNIGLWKNINTTFYDHPAIILKMRMPLLCKLLKMTCRTKMPSLKNDGKKFYSRSAYTDPSNNPSKKFFLIL